MPAGHPGGCPADVYGGGVRWSRWHRTCSGYGGTLRCSRRTARDLLVLDILRHPVILRLASGLLPGRTLHRRALAASSAGRHVDAEQLFEAAAAAYRRELRVEPLARLRVHQAMARARASRDPALEATMMLEIVRGLNKLDHLETFRPPHALVDAREVFAAWLAESPGASGASAAPAAA